MLQLIFRPIATVFALLALCIGVIRVGYALAFPFEDAGVFAMSACELPCWMGLEVVSTSLDNTLNILQGYEPTSYGYDKELFFSVTDHLKGTVLVGESLEQMTLYFYGCAIVPIVELGKPDVVLLGGRQIDLIYQSYKLSLQFYIVEGEQLLPVEINFLQEQLAADLTTQVNSGMVSFVDPRIVEHLSSCSH